METIHRRYSPIRHINHGGILGSRLSMASQYDGGRHQLLPYSSYGSRHAICGVAITYSYSLGGTVLPVEK